MLTLEQCRRVLGETMHLDDDALIALRSQLYRIAELALDSVNKTPVLDEEIGGGVPEGENQ